MDFPLSTTTQNEHFQKQLCCPLCSSVTLTLFLRRIGVPVLTNLLMDTQEAARQIQRGNIFLVICENCGFMFNRAFESSARYNSLYENSQARSLSGFSPSLQAHKNVTSSEMLHLQETLSDGPEERPIRQCL